MTLISRDAENIPALCLVGIVGPDLRMELCAKVAGHAIDADPVNRSRFRLDESTLYLPPLVARDFRRKKKPHAGFSFHGGAGDILAVGHIPCLVGEIAAPSGQLIGLCTEFGVRNQVGIGLRPELHCCNDEEAQRQAGFFCLHGRFQSFRITHSATNSSMILPTIRGLFHKSRSLTRE